MLGVVISGEGRAWTHRVCSKIVTTGLTTIHRAYFRGFNGWDFHKILFGFGRIRYWLPGLLWKLIWYLSLKHTTNFYFSISHISVIDISLSRWYVISNDITCHRLSTFLSGQKTQNGKVLLCLRTPLYSSKLNARDENHGTCNVNRPIDFCCNHCVS